MIAEPALVLIAYIRTTGTVSQVRPVFFEQPVRGVYVSTEAFHPDRVTRLQQMRGNDKLVERVPLSLKLMRTSLIVVANVSQPLPGVRSFAELFHTFVCWIIVKIASNDNQGVGLLPLQLKNSMAEHPGGSLAEGGGAGYAGVARGPVVHEVVYGVGGEQNASYVQDITGGAVRSADEDLPQCVRGSGTETE